MKKKNQYRILYPLTIHIPGLPKFGIEAELHNWSSSYNIIKSQIVFISSPGDFQLVMNNFLGSSCVFAFSWVLLYVSIVIPRIPLVQLSVKLKIFQDMAEKAVFSMAAGFNYTGHLKK